MIELARGRFAVAHAHGHQAQRVVADQHAGVHRGRRKRVEIFGERELAERRPGRRRAQIVLQELHLAGQAWRHREPAMADDFGGDPLAHFAFCLGIDRQREVGVGLDVDEARRNGEAPGVNDLLRRFGELRSDRNDAAVLDCHIARHAGGSAAVVKEAAADQDVRHGKLASGRGRKTIAGPEVSGATGKLKPASISGHQPMRPVGLLARRVSQSGQSSSGVSHGPCTGRRGCAGDNVDQRELGFVPAHRPLRQRDLHAISARQGLRLWRAVRRLRRAYAGLHRVCAHTPGVGG